MNMQKDTLSVRKAFNRKKLSVAILGVLSLFLIAYFVFLFNGGESVEGTYRLTIENRSDGILDEVELCKEADGQDILRFTNLALSRGQKTHVALNLEWLADSWAVKAAFTDGTAASGQIPGGMVEWTGPFERSELLQHEAGVEGGIEVVLLKNGNEVRFDENGLAIGSESWQPTLLDLKIVVYQQAIEVECSVDGGFEIHIREREPGTIAKLKRVWRDLW